MCWSWLGEELSIHAMHKTSFCFPVAPKSLNLEDPFFLPYLISPWQSFITEVTLILILNMYSVSYCSYQHLLAPYCQRNRISKPNMALETICVGSMLTSWVHLHYPFWIPCTSHTSRLAIPRTWINFHACVFLFSLISLSEVIFPFASTIKCFSFSRVLLKGHLLYEDFPNPWA